MGRQRKQGSGPASHQSVDALSRLKRISTSSIRVREQVKAPQLDGIVEALDMLEDACAVMAQVRADLKLLAEPVIAASAEPDMATRALFADEYDERRETLSSHVVGSQDAAAVLLSQDATAFSVVVDEVLTYRIGRFPIALGPEGLGLPAPAGAFAEPREVVAVLKAIQAALDKLDRATSRYAQDKAFLERKLAFLRDSVVQA
ncbi:MAG: hypothetical protein AAGA69_00235 [Pseudomonadota bacterium]